MQMQFLTSQTLRKHHRISLMPNSISMMNTPDVLFLKSFRSQNDSKKRSMNMFTRVENTNPFHCSEKSCLKQENYMIPRCEKILVSETSSWSLKSKYRPQDRCLQKDTVRITAMC